MRTCHRFMTSRFRKFCGNLVKSSSLVFILYFSVMSFWEFKLDVLIFVPLKKKDFLETDTNGWKFYISVFIIFYLLELRTLLSQIVCVNLCQHIVYQYVILNIFLLFLFRPVTQYWRYQWNEKFLVSKLTFENRNEFWGCEYGWRSSFSLLSTFEPLLKIITIFFSLCIYFFLWQLKLDWDAFLMILIPLAFDWGILSEYCWE